jgi:hypothetical protein
MVDIAGESIGVHAPTTAAKKVPSLADVKQGAM